MPSAASSGCIAAGPAVVAAGAAAATGIVAVVSATLGGSSLNCTLFEGPGVAGGAATGAAGGDACSDAIAAGALGRSPATALTAGAAEDVEAEAAAAPAGMVAAVGPAMASAEKKWVVATGNSLLIKELQPTASTPVGVQANMLNVKVPGQQAARPRTNSPVTAYGLHPSCAGIPRRAAQLGCLSS